LKVAKKSDEYSIILSSYKTTGSPKCKKILQVSLIIGRQTEFKLHTLPSIGIFLPPTLEKLIIFHTRVGRKYEKISQN